MLGHNVGAKTAMTFACRYPDRVSSLISLDTLPVSFPPEHENMQRTLTSLKEVEQLNVTGKSRKAAIDTIQKHYADKGIGNLIIGNLVYDEDSNNKRVKWCINLEAIINNYPSLVGFDETLPAYNGPALFINGSMTMGVLQ